MIAKRWSLLRLGGLLGGLAGMALAHAVEPPPVQALLLAKDEATLSSRMAGQISELQLKAGDSFVRGQVLLRFDCALGEQEAKKARAQLDIARATLASNLKLKALESISDLEVAIARAEQDKAEAEVARSAIQMRYCDLAAPWDGRVVERHGNPLENVAVGQPLLTIIATGTPSIQMFVPSAALAWLTVGVEFELEVRETGQRYRARLARVGARVDAVSQTVELYGEFLGQHPELLPGMSGSAFLQSVAPGE
jgi:membrane fusion protein, multidrug efflux system